MAGSMKSLVTMSAAVSPGFSALPCPANMGPRASIIRATRSRSKLPSVASGPSATMPLSNWAWTEKAATPAE